MARKKRTEFLAQQKNRTSIVLAMSKGMREKIFKNEHLADIEDIIINNLDLLESRMDTVDDLPKARNKNILFRTKIRQRTQLLPIHNGDNNKSNRRASNFQFLNQAFNLSKPKVSNTNEQLKPNE